MKMWKKLAACVLAAAMALTLLTACGGGGGGGSTTPVTQNTELENKYVGYFRNYMDSYCGKTVNKDDTLRAIAYDNLPQAVSYMKSAIAGNADYSKFQTLQTKASTAIQKNGGMYGYLWALPLTKEVSQSEMNQILDTSGVKETMSNSMLKNVNKVGLAVTTSDGIDYVLIIVSD